MNRPRVVVTGIGAISPLGLSVRELWNGISEGRSGIRRITQFDASNLPCQIAGEIPGFIPENYMDKKAARRMARSSQIALAAGREAMTNANLPSGMPEPERAAVVFGTGIGGLDVYDENQKIYRAFGLSRVNPFALAASIPNMPAYTLGREFKCLGPSTTLTTACATSTQAIGEAAELIRRGAADIVITGGTEALIQDIAIAGFAAMRALPVNFNEQPERASRPFDGKREGFVFSEGAGVLVLESLEHAQSRSAPILTEILGHASSADGYHMTAPDPEAEGPARAMRWALRDAGISFIDIDYINAHGTSTQLNDATETRAIKATFNERAYKVPISSTKSMIGHPMGASGALEAVLAICTILASRIPPTINYEYPDPELDLDYVPNQARQAQVDTVLSNSFGLGGQNSCLVIRRFAD